jgi:hypothetical protein
MASLAALLDELDTELSPNARNLLALQVSVNVAELKPKQSTGNELIDLCDEIVEFITRKDDPELRKLCNEIVSEP